MSGSEKFSGEKSMGGWAFYPFIILIGIVLARIFYNIIAGLPQTGNSFPITGVTMIAAICSLLAGRGKISDRINAFTVGAGDPMVIMMVMIILLAGVFTAVSSAMGGIESVTNFLLTLIPKNMIYAGILFVTSVISLAIGSSVGSATAVAPIAAAIATQAGLSLPIAISAVLGGASLGDNLSFISDTTIAATRTQGVSMRDKFKFNVALVIPAFVISMAIYCVIGMKSADVDIALGGYNFIKMLPYVYIIVAAVAGMNMMLVLISGIALSAVIGFAFGSLTIISFVGAVSAGMTKMTNTIFTAILVKGIMAVVELNGGTEWLIGKLTGNVKSEKGAQYSVAALAFCLGALIRSTSAIIVAGPLAKEICKPYGVDARRTASILDIFATAQNGFVFWAGLTVDCASLVEKVTSTDLVFYAIYPACIIIITLLSIKFSFLAGKKPSVQ